MTVKITIGAPPKKKARPTIKHREFDLLYKAISRNPGVWVRAERISRNGAYALRKRIKNSPIGEDTVVTWRGDEKGMYNFYAKYEKAP